MHVSQCAPISCPIVVGHDLDTLTNYTFFLFPDVWSKNPAGANPFFFNNDSEETKNVTSIPAETKNATTKKV